MTEKKLKKALDFQHFERNPRLERYAQQARERNSAALSDDELSQVNAAGETYTEEREKKAH